MYLIELNIYLIELNIYLIELNKEMWQTIDIYLSGLIMFIDYLFISHISSSHSCINQRNMIIKKENKPNIL